MRLKKISAFWVSVRFVLENAQTVLSWSFQTVVNLNTTTDVSVATGAFLSFNNVLNLNGFDPAAGDVFDIIDSSAIGGVGFDSLSLPPLAAGLAWDTSTLMTDGSLSISAVPEPAAAVLLGLALVGLVANRRPFSSGCDNCRIKG